MRYTLATEIKFNTHVLWTLSFKFVNKEFVFVREYGKRIFFSRVHQPAQEPNAALDLARNCTSICLSAFALMYTSVKRISLSF